MNKKRVKKTFYIHHWLGLVVGIFLLIISVSGSILVFHHEIDHRQYAGMAVLEKPAATLLIDNSYERIKIAHPGYDIRIPEFPDDPEQALKYELRKGVSRKWIFVHPESGETLGIVRQADQRLVHILLNIHYNLLSGTPGKVVVLFCGLALIALTISGFMLYRKSILKVLCFRQSISFKSRRAFFSSLHRVVGVWSLVFNLVISITGSWIAYTIVESAFSSGSAAASGASSYYPYRSVDKALQQLKRDHADFEIKYLRFPQSPGGQLSVLGRLESDPAYFGRTSSKVSVDLITGTVQGVNFLKDATWSERALKIFKPLHFGDFAGQLVKIIYSFFGVFPALLAISGFIIWRKRSLPKARVQQNHTSKPLLSSTAVRA